MLPIDTLNRSFGYYARCEPRRRADATTDRWCLVERRLSSTVALVVSSIVTIRRRFIGGTLRLGVEGIHTYRRGAATEALRTEILEQDIIEPRKPLQRVTRCQELAIELSGCLLDAGRRVHHVTVIDNRSPAAPHFTRDH